MKCLVFFLIFFISADKTVLPLPNSKEEKAAKNDDQNEVKEEETKEKETPTPSFLSEEGQKIIDEVFEKKIKEETSIEIGVWNFLTRFVLPITFIASRIGHRAFSFSYIFFLNL